MNIITDRANVTMADILEEYRKYAPKVYKINNRLKLTVYKHSNPRVNDYKEYIFDFYGWTLVIHRAV